MSLMHTDKSFFHVFQFLPQPFTLCAGFVAFGPKLCVSRLRKLLRLGVFGVFGPLVNPIAKMLTNTRRGTPVAVFGTVPTKTVVGSLVGNVT